MIGAFLGHIRMVHDQGYGENRPATTRGVLYAIPSGSFKLHQKTPATGHQRRDA